MRKTLALLLVTGLVVAVLPATAELQNVQIGGELRIRGNWYTNYSPSPTGAEIRIPAFFLPFRAIGSGPFNGLGIVSGFAWDDNDSNSMGFVEQRTRLSVKADFTNDVSAFIELDSYDIWGEDFRSNYITGADGRANSVDDVEVYQAYIEADNMWNMPLRMRVGRQEMPLGSQWLVGVNDTAAFFRGLSFDAVRLTYTHDVFTLDAFAAILAEGGIAEEDEDVWLYGVYGSYVGMEGLQLDLYWLFLRDARSLNDTNFIAPIEWVEDVFGLDDYDVTNVHTVGLRGAGTFGNLDFEAEVAYQFGEADQVGFLFKPFLYGDDGADFDAWGANLEIGYTFDIAMQPRVFIGGAYFGGEDNRDVTFWEWLNPFDRPEASVSFNRLFSNWEYSEFLENTDLSNAYVIRAGVSVMPTESIEVLLKAAYFESLEAFDTPAYFNLGRWMIPIAPALPFWTMENETYLGTEVGLYVTYHYSEDLVFEAGWAHLFTDDGLDEGNFSNGNGLLFNGGSGSDDADYVFVETRLSF